MGEEVLICIGVLAVLATIVMYLLFVNSGDISRQEEKNARLRPCPVCGNIPKLGCCCGEYFVAGDDPDCPGCGTAFTEMHSSPQMEINAWNRRAEDGRIEIVSVLRL